MRNILLVARREYLERVRTRAFILTTILLPVFVIAVFAIPILLISKAGGGKTLAIAAADQRLASFIADDLKKDEGSSKTKQQPQAKSTLEIFTPSDEVRASLQHRVEAKQLTGYLWIEPGADGNPKATYVSGSSGDLMTQGTLSEALRSALFRERLLDKGLSQTEIDKLNAPIHIETQSLENGKAKKKNAFASYIGAYALMMLLYISVILYGMNVSRSIIEEKTTRVFEVLLSTVRPTELMFGKILGVGAVGMTQLAAWILMGSAVLGYSALASAMQQNNFNISISPVQIAFFVIFFILGYLFYAAMCAALGSAVNTDRELQQLSMIVTGPLIAALLCLNYVVAAPDSTVSLILSLIPPFTPLLMYLRIAVSNVPVWQSVLSIVLLAGSAALMIYICSRIYRIGILMYGKRPTLPEILRWLRYS